MTGAGSSGHESSSCFDSCVSSSAPGSSSCADSGVSWSAHEFAHDSSWRADSCVSSAAPGSSSCGDSGVPSSAHESAHGSLLCTDSGIPRIRGQGLGKNVLTAEAFLKAALSVLKSSSASLFDSGTAGKIHPTLSKNLLRPEGILLPRDPIIRTAAFEMQQSASK